MPLTSWKILFDPANASKLAGCGVRAAADTPIRPHDSSLIADPAVYPPPEQLRRLFVQTEDSPEQARAMTRLWQRFKTGR